jgi:hypothetical protein
MRLLAAVKSADGLTDKYAVSRFPLPKSGLRNQTELAIENLALRQQPTILKQTHSRRQLRKTDQLSWVWRSRLCEGWQESLIIVKSDTVIRWHSKGFALYWRWLLRSKRIGRPGTGKEVRELTRLLAFISTL